MNRDWFAVACPVTPPVPFRGVRHHLGLGADWWPLFDGSEAIAAEVDAATDWYPFETLIGREWQAVLCDRALAERYLQAARRHLLDAALLCLSTRALDDCMGWDVGPTHGGHSIAIHEIGAAAFADWAGETTADGLFRRRADAENFLARRAQAPQPAGLEEAGAWSIVCVARLDGGDRTARGREPSSKSSDYARTGVQANFHERGRPPRNDPHNLDSFFDEGQSSNVHVHVR